MTSSRRSLVHVLDARPAWGLGILGILWVLGMPHYFEDARALLGVGLSVPGYRLATAANTLLAVSTALYFTNLWLENGTARSLAPGFALAGAALLVVDILMRSVGWADSPRTVITAESNAFEIVALVTVVLVVSGLLAEQAFRTTVAGAFFMPLVMGGVAAQIWLINHGLAGQGFSVFTGLRSYWAVAYLLAQVIGYGAFLAAALLSVLYLFRFRAEREGRAEAFTRRRIPGLWSLYAMIISMLAVGLPVFLVAALFLSGWSIDVMAWTWRRVALNAWAVGVVVVFGLLAYRVFTRSLAGPRLATHVIVGFGATLAAFTALHFLPDVKLGADLVAVAGRALP